MTNKECVLFNRRGYEGGLQLGIYCNYGKLTFKRRVLDSGMEFINFKEDSFLAMI